MAHKMAIDILIKVNEVEENHQSEIELLRNERNLLFSEAELIRKDRVFIARVLSSLIKFPDE